MTARERVAAMDAPPGLMQGVSDPPPLEHDDVSRNLPVPDQSAVPSELTSRRQWIVWRHETRKEKPKPTKVPYYAAGRRASSTNRATWLTFDAASALAAHDGFNGIGFVFARDYIGVDLDQCRDATTGTIADWAWHVIAAVDSYTEISPSGTGVHILTRGAWPESGRKLSRPEGGAIEVYGCGRYFTVTGRHIPETPREIRDRLDAVRLLVPAEAPAPAPSAGRPADADRTRNRPAPVARQAEDAALIARIADSLDARAWHRLFVAGETQPHPSASEADLELAGLLRRHTDDAEQIERLMRHSTLRREKYDRADYLPRTIAAAGRNLGHAERPASGRPAADDIPSDGTAASADAKPSDDTPLDAVPAWPTPLGRAAAPGLVGDILGTLDPQTEADPAGLLAHLLVAFGSSIGRAAYFVVEGTWHHANLFALCVGPTSKGRKGTAWGQIRRLFLEVDEGWVHDRVQGGLVSGEGLIWNVRDPIYQTTTKDGVDTRELTDPGVTDKRLCVLETEYAAPLRVMGRDGSSLGATLRQAWDMGELSTLGKHSPAKATGAHVSILGHISVEELRRELQTTDAANGFLNRHLLFMVRRSKKLPEGGDLDPTALRPLVRGLRGAVDHARKLAELRRDPAARERWRVIYDDLSDEGPPGLLGAVLGRAEAQVARVSLVYALLDGCREIGERHLAAALEVWRYCAASAAFIFGERLGDPLADKVSQLLAESGEAGMTRSELYDALSRNVPRETISTVLRKLNGYGRVWQDVEPTAGRPVERWRVTRTRKTRKEGLATINAFNAYAGATPTPRPGDALREGDS